MEAHSRAFGQPSTKGLYSSPNVIDQLRAATYQHLTRADDRQMGLGVLTAVFEWVEQFRIHSCEASEILSIYLVGLALVGVDEPYLAGIGHQNLVSTLLEHPTHPW